MDISHSNWRVIILAVVLTGLFTIAAAYIGILPQLKGTELEQTQTVIAIQQTQTAIAVPANVNQPLLTPVLTEHMEGVSPTNSSTPEQPLIVELTSSRGDGLLAYEAIYSNQGLCALWTQVIQDGLVSGNCPDWTGRTPAYEMVSTSIGEQRVFSGIEITATSDIDINFPTCVNFQPDLLRYIGDAVIIDWEPPTQTGTNMTVERGSIFSIYFRCDHIYANLFFNN